MKAIRTCLAAVLALLLFVSVALSCLSCAAWRELSALPQCADEIVDEEYISLLSNAVRDRLHTTLAVSALQPTDVADLFDAELLSQESRAALSDTLRALTGEEGEPYRFASEPLRMRVEAFLRQYAEEYELVYEDAAAEENYEAIRSAVEGELLVVARTYCNTLAPSVRALGGRLRQWYLFVAASVVLAGLLAFTLRKEWRKAAVYLASSAYFSSLAVLSAAYILYCRDYFAVTVLTDPVLQYLIRQLYRLVLRHVWQGMLPVTAVFALLLVLALALLAAKKPRPEAPTEDHTT